MDRYTYETLLWLDLHFDPRRRAECGQAYVPYQPIDGIAAGRWTPKTFLMASRWGRMLYHLRRIGARSFLDVGGAEGFVADLVHRVLGIPAVSLDLSTQAGLRGREFFDIPTVSGESHLLPFADGAFDVVYMGEVIEHLAHPIRSLAEISRVTRRAVIVTSEAFVGDDEQRARELAERDAAPFVQPHMDRSFLTRRDYELAFGAWNVLVTNQCAFIPDPVPQDEAALRRCFFQALTSHELAAPAHAVFVLADREAQPNAPDEDIAEDIVAFLARVRPSTQKRHVRAQNAEVEGELASRLVCPVTRAPLERRGDRLHAPGGRSYAVSCGVPAMLTPLGEDLPNGLIEVLTAQFGEDAAAELADIEARLAYAIPQPATESVFLETGIGRWRPGPGVMVRDKPGGGVVLASERPDPFLFSPRLDRPISEVRGITLEMSVTAEQTFEEAQVFFWTLTRPLWCEAGSAKLGYVADGGLTRLYLSLPPGYPDDDELLAVRIDPTHGPSEAAIVRVVIEG